MEPKFVQIEQSQDIVSDDVLDHECYIHKMKGNASWWWKHVEEYEHEHVGVTNCKDCGKPDVFFVYVGKLFNRTLPPAYCEDHKK